MESDLKPLFGDGSLVHHLNKVYGLRNVNDKWLYCNRNTPRKDIPGMLCAADICNVSEGSLPWNIHEAHSVQLRVKVFVEIEDSMNAAASDPTRSGPPSLLQFTFTDGSLRFVALEVNTRESEFSSQLKRGSKVILFPTAVVRRGRLLFTADDYEIVRATHSAQFRHGDSTPLLAASKNKTETDLRKERVSPAQGLRAPARPSGMNVRGMTELVSPSDRDQRWSRITIRSRCADVRENSQTRNGSLHELGQRAVNAGFSHLQELQHPSLVSRNEHTSDILGKKGEEATATIPIPPTMFELFVGEADDADLAQRNNGKSNILASDAVHGRGRERKQCCPIVHGTERRGPVAGSVRRSGGIKASHSNAFTYVSFTRLRDLAYAKHFQKAQQGVCRLYAIKVGKPLQRLQWRNGYGLVVVDDGTAVVIVSMTRRQYCNSGSCGLCHDELIVTSRAVSGLVQFEMQNEYGTSAIFCSKGNSLVRWTGFCAPLETVCGQDLHFLT